MDAREFFPLTLKHLGPSAPAAKTPKAFVESVCAAHAKGDIPSRATRDLVNYEALLMELRPTPLASVAPLPRDDEPCVIAAHVRVLIFGGALPEMLAALRAGRKAEPRPARGWILAWLGADGQLQELILPREEGWLLERFRGPATPGDALEDDEREAFAHLWSRGVVRRA